MGKVRMRAVVKLKGSTLIETMVASSIFLLVFMISMETTTKLVAGQTDNTTVYMEADYALKSCFREYSKGTYRPGKYCVEYEWGWVEVAVAQYGSYEQLQELTITANMTRVRKKIEYKHIVPITY